MKRKDFIKALSLLPAAAAALSLKDLHAMTSPLATTVPMPALFLGHGNPMHAIQENDFTRGWQQAARQMPTPTAILCISAHWETKGTFVTAMQKPRTIHDFGGFPKELFAVQYPAPGSTDLVKQAQQAITKTTIELDHTWGLDHGAWSVIKHLYPKANIPVVQLSIDYTKPPQWHYELAQELAVLRRKGILVIGSGNMVHNLGIIDWSGSKTFDWALQANNQFKQLIAKGDHKQLANYKALGKEVQLAVPSPEHYLPLLYVLGMKGPKEQSTFFNDRLDMGSISMTSVKIG